MANHDKGDSQPLEGPGAAVLLGAGCCCTWYFLIYRPPGMSFAVVVQGWATRLVGCGSLPGTHAPHHRHNRGGVPRGEGRRDAQHRRCAAPPILVRTPSPFPELCPSAPPSPLSRARNAARQKQCSSGRACDRPRAGPGMLCRGGAGRSSAP
ncbi:hypothetical protein B0T11DRAFT_110880 [Plectosphaerella cucumerina]|uniref:Uncharacterized protein n=1 Tax=Plectosphaerella cucumerina TaxID=40658 RepID=A0A8K0X3Q0_9PEZI|nr:hypothetical protein B0T11DRAFT_110880 [Plectosphaerella cucumerina]